MFVLRGIRFQQILDIPSLSLESPICCMIGRSGSGKTTLLRLLNRLYEPDQGEILYHGLPINRMDPVALRRKVVMLGQTPTLYDGNIADNLQIGLSFSQKPAASASAMTDVLEQVGLSQPLDAGCDRLSGGEKQRLCLARVLLLDAETYLMDEPSAALDTQTEGFLIQKLADFVRERQKQLILVTHSHQISDLFPDSVIQLEEGRLLPQPSRKGELS